MGMIHEFAPAPRDGFTTGDCETELAALYCGRQSGLSETRGTLPEVRNLVELLNVLFA